MSDRTLRASRDKLLSCGRREESVGCILAVGIPAPSIRLFSFVVATSFEVHTNLSFPKPRLSKLRLFVRRLLTPCIANQTLRPHSFHLVNCVGMQKEHIMLSRQSQASDLDTSPQVQDQADRIRLADADTTTQQLVNRNSSKQLPVSRRLGLTLIEVMIAVSLTLVLMIALISMFSYASGEITKGRAVIELAQKLRMTGEKLREDLKGVTVPMRPWTNPDDGLGYFEYFEGNPVRIDPIRSVAPGVIDNTVGDIDDVLMFTARSTGRPFRGRFWIPGATAPTIVESEVAEIIWWTTIEDLDADGELDLDEELVLHRRVLLVRPDLNTSPNQNIWSNNNLYEFYERNDISVRPTPNGLAANSLADLTKRENRFAHSWGFAPPAFPANTLADINNSIVGAFPYPIDRAMLDAFVLIDNYEGEDVLLSTLLAFDVKAYDSRVPTYRSPAAQVTLLPDDPGYVYAMENDRLDAVMYNDPTVVGAGGYVDLGFATSYIANLPGTTNPAVAPFTLADFVSPFAGRPTGLSRMQAGAILNDHRCYSTWPTSYESDGIDQDGLLGVDQGTNGVDDNNVGGPDDQLERETLPPYPFPLRGIQITIRVVERDTQQIRQSTVVQNFVPE